MTDVFELLREAELLPLADTDRQAVDELHVEAKARISTVAHPVDPSQYPEPRRTELSTLMESLQDIETRARAITDRYTSGRSDQFVEPSPQ